MTTNQDDLPTEQEFANFLKKRASIEETNAGTLKRLSQGTKDNMSRADHLGGTFSKAFDGMMTIHERIAENGLQFAMSLYQMTEDILELAAFAEKQRKGWKQQGLTAEQRVADVDAQMRKSHAKYLSLAEEYDRARTGDGAKGKVFGFKGPKSAAQHEEELLRKVQAADQDYQHKVQVLQQERGQLISTTRPEAIKALQDIVKECDSGLLLQMQKFGRRHCSNMRGTWLTGHCSVFQREAIAEQRSQHQPAEERKFQPPRLHESQGNRTQRRRPKRFERLPLRKPQQGAAADRGA